MDTANYGMQAGQSLGLGALNKATPPAQSRATQLTGRLDVLYSQLREVRGMTYGATERILGSEPTSVGNASTSGQIAGAVQVCFMAQTENAIGDIERVVAEIRDELGRINRAF